MFTSHLLRLLVAGFVTGLALQPVFSFSFQLATRLFDRLRFPYVAELVCSYIAAVLVSGVFFLAPAWLLGLIPLRGSGPLFVVAFLSGAAVQRVWTGRPRRRRSSKELRL